MVEPSDHRYHRNRYSWDILSDSRDVLLANTSASYQSSCFITTLICSTSQRRESLPPLNIRSGRQRQKLNWPLGPQRWRWNLHSKKQRPRSCWVSVIWREKSCSRSSQTNSGGMNRGEWMMFLYLDVSGWGRLVYCPSNHSLNAVVDPAIEINHKLSIHNANTSIIERNSCSHDPYGFLKFLTQVVSSYESLESDCSLM